MMSEFWCYSLLYWLFALVVIFPPDEMVAAGLTVEALLGSWLGSQMTGFVQYHIKRTAATLLIHSLIAPGYIIMLIKFHPSLVVWAEVHIHPYTTIVVLLLSCIPLAAASVVVRKWWLKNWQQHPLCQTLTLYSQAGVAVSPNAWVTVASNVNAEFRSVDKFSTKANSVCRVVATDSWLMKITAYNVHLTHQRDAVLSLESSMDHQLTPNSSSEIQLLDIRVTSIKEGISPFYIRLTATEYAELQLKIVNPVVNARQVLVQQSLSDRFFYAFSEAVNLNPKFSLDEAEMCIGCMEVVANVKLQRLCEETTGASRCVTCYCRPMWCLACLSKWFAARQDQNHPETWLSSKAPCPTCRSTFCLLDVTIASVD